MNAKRLIVIAILVVVITAIFVFGLLEQFTLENLQAQRDSILLFYSNNKLITVIAFFCIYVGYTGLSLPGAAPLTLIAGALFGFVAGLLVVSFASTLGATLACLLSRYLFRDAVQTRYETVFRKVNEGVANDGMFYLFALRLVPAFPFFVVNLVMGLTQIRMWTYCWVSQLGMLAGTVVFVNAGSQLAKINSIADILSPSMLFAFTLLGLLPISAKKTLDYIRRRRLLREKASS